MYKKKSISRVLALVMLMIFMATAGVKVYAAGETATEDEDPFKLVFVRPQNCFELSSALMLRIYSSHSTGDSGVKERAMYDQTKGNVYLIHSYDKNGNVTNENKVYDDDKFDSFDAGYLLGLKQVPIETSSGVYKTADDMQKGWNESIRDLVLTLIDVKKNDGLASIKEDDITVTSRVFFPKADFEMSNEDQKVEIHTDATEYTIGNKKKISNEEYANATKIRENEEKIVNVQGLPQDQALVSVTADVTDGSQYKLVVGLDYNWYWVRTKEPTPKEEPKKDVFATELSYEAISPTKDPNEIKGKMDGNTFLPPYYDNDVNKKDLDALAFITSKTDEGIVATDGVAMINEANKPNSKGWYYPDANNKKVIAKKYPFDDYDNTRDNGMVNETVKVTGEKGGEDTQNPSIRWTFRRVKIEEQTNPDGSITVTITYNLPVDPASIPADWEAIVDPDGSIHKIKRTIKKGENYDKNVTVKQNGTDAKVTTPVVKKWPAPTEIVHAGESATLLVVLAGVTIGGIVFRRRMKK